MMFDYKGYLQSRDIIVCHLVTSPFKSVYFQTLLQKLLAQNYRSYNHEKIPNESNNIFIVAPLYILFSYCSHLNTKAN